MSIKHNIFFIICTVFTINAMEVEDNTAPSTICYLTLLPREIHDHIASYLIFNDRESDDEFIARTKTYGAISQEHLGLIQQHESKTFHWGEGSLGTLRTYSIDGSKIISLEKKSDKS